MLRIHDVKVDVLNPVENIVERVEKMLDSGRSLKIEEWSINKKSIDARDKGRVVYIFSVDFKVTNMTDETVLKKVAKNKKLKINKIDSSKKYNPIVAKEQTRNKETARNVVVGFGPAGMFAGLILALNGTNPIIIERGKAIDERVKDVTEFWKNGKLNTESNVLFGEGGAGTFSDGKLTTGKNDPRNDFVIEAFVEAGISEDLRIMRKPHIGTDKLRDAVRNIRKRIIEAGGQVLFSTSLSDIIISDGQINSIKVLQDGKPKTIPCKNLLLAIGHSARDTIKMLFERGVYIEQKPFSIGVRIEHPQKMIDESQYGKKVNNKAQLPPAEYKLSTKVSDGRGVYTFCMCPGGEVIPTSAEAGHVSTNGMSNSSRSGKWANSAVLVDVRTDDYKSDHPLAGLDFQRLYESLAFKYGGGDYSLPFDTVGDFVRGESELELCLPSFAVDGIKEALPVFGRKIKGFDSEDALLKGTETGSSSSVRIKREKNYSSNIEGLYPLGEGAGYAGGIMSAAVDGIKGAEAVLSD